MGSDKSKPFNHIKKSSLQNNNGQSVPIKELLPRLNIKNYSIEVLENDKIVVGYNEDQRRYNLVLINSDFTIDHAWKSDSKRFEQWGFSISKNKIVYFESYLKSNHYYETQLITFNSDLTVNEKLLVNGVCEKVICNDNNIYLFKRNKIYSCGFSYRPMNTKIKIFDWSLKLRKEVGQSEFPTGLYYIGSLKNVSLVMNQSLLYLFYSTRFDIMDIETGKRIKSVYVSSDIERTRLQIDSKGDLYLWSRNKNIIFRYIKDVDKIDVNKPDETISVPDVNLKNLIVYQDGRKLFFT